MLHKCRKRLKTKNQKVLRTSSMFVEVTGKTLVRGGGGGGGLPKLLILDMVNKCGDSKTAHSTRKKVRKCSCRFRKI